VKYSIDPITPTQRNDAAAPAQAGAPFRRDLLRAAGQAERFEPTVEDVSARPTT
jgi:hypothetical protein